MLPRAAPPDQTRQPDGPNGLTAQDRLRQIVQDNHHFVWRFLRRLGVDLPQLEDAVQQVFLITSDRIADIVPGAERSWVVGAAIRVAAQAKRQSSRERERCGAGLESRADPAPMPDELADSRRARLLLDKVLDGMPDELRAVFVLFELEQLTGAEIAELLGLAPGTVASRLRRARDCFKEATKRLGLCQPQGGQTR